MVAPFRLFMIVVATLATAITRGSAVDERSEWWRHVVALANDQREGRDTGSLGERHAAEYVAGEFASVGIGPVSSSGYFQTVPLAARRVIESASRIELVRGHVVDPLVLGEDVVINPGIDPAETLEAPLVFVGYGLRIPEMNYDDLSGLDVRGAVVVRFAGAPASVADQLRAHYQSTTEFTRALADAGAAGVVTILDPRASVAWSQSRHAGLQEAMDLSDAGLGPARRLRLAVTASPASADRWFAGSGHRVNDLAALARTGDRLPRFSLARSIRARVHVERRRVTSQNVVAVLPGTDPTVRGEDVVIAAHLDHLGVGEAVDGDRIYNGALDNAAGVATILDVAQRLSRIPGARPRRSVLFLVTTGEEKGMLGSRHFVDHPSVALRDVVAMINCDMFLPIHPATVLTAFGMNESSLAAPVTAVARARGLSAQDDPVPQRNTFTRSDQYAFVRKGIPSVMVSLGAVKGTLDEQAEVAWLSQRYHAPSDDLEQPIDLQAANDFDRAVLALVQAVANDAARPQWNANSFFRRFGEGAQ